MHIYIYIHTLYTGSKLPFQWTSKRSMTNLPSINDTIIYFFKLYWLQTLCTMKIMKCFKTIPRLHNFNSLLAVCRIIIFGVEKRS